MKVEHIGLVNKLRRLTAVWAVVCQNPAKPAPGWILLRLMYYNYGTGAGRGQKGRVKVAAEGLIIQETANNTHTNAPIDSVIILCNVSSRKCGDCVISIQKYSECKCTSIVKTHCVKPMFWQLPHRSAEIPKGFLRRMPLNSETFNICQIWNHMTALF